MSNKSFLKPLSKDDEAYFLDKLQNGNEYEQKFAKDKLILHNLRLVAHIAKKYTLLSSDPEELISIGTIGLIKAINSYDIAKNVKLASYSAKCIQNEILMHLRNTKKNQNDISLQEPIGTDRDGNEIVMMDIIAIDSPDFIEALDILENTKKMWKFIISKLSKRERLVLIYRYGLLNQDTLTQQEIADKLDISRSYVSRIEKKALKKLHNEF